MLEDAEIVEDECFPADRNATPAENGMDSDDEEKLCNPGDIVPLDDYAKPADGDEGFTALAETIHAQMGLFSHRNAAILSAWSVQGKHRAGGELLALDPAATRENGDLFAVSYHLRDDYTVTYAKRDGDNTVIIKEIDMVYADQLCETFTDMTGIEIPVVPFG